MKTIAIIFLTYLLLKYLGRILQQDSSAKKEGEVSIKTKPKKSKTDTNDMGEYVDFEEVDD